MIDSVRIASPDHPLYPDCTPRASGMLRLDARHVMTVAGPRRVSRAVARAQLLLARIGDEDDSALEHVHELVLERVPMSKGRLAARSERHDIDAEVREPAGVPQAPLHAIAHP